tara:strand:- start:12200 stop:12940 length:741 start_codon:yes stop_codon:yes gene_type:complete
LKVLVVDDEALARQRLRRLLERVRPGAQYLEADGGQAALTQVQRHEPDFVLLDIRMPGLDGIEVAERLDALPNPPAVVFCSAYDEYALEALRHQAVAYLLKPVRETELARALDNAARVNRVQLASLRGLEAQDEKPLRSRVSSQTHRGLETLAVSEIRCFIAGDKYVTAHAAEAELVIPDTLKELEAEFSGQFMRVHRNALVALAYVEALNHQRDGGWYVALDGLALRPQVSRRHLKSVKARLRTR